jgi:hypothetical protein
MPERKRPTILVISIFSSIAGLLLAVVGVVRHRTDQLITVLYELFFVARSRLVQRHGGSEPGNAAQPRMRGVTG